MRRAGNAVLLIVVAVGGAALALLGAAAFGKLGTTTVEQEASQPAVTVTQNTAAATPQGGLTDEEIYRRDAPGVVQITATSTQTQTDPFGLLPPTSQTEQALGSGFVIDKAGHIVTNEHVVAGATKVQVSFSGQDAIPATVVGKDASTDIAVLKVNARTRALTPLVLGNSDAVQVGDPVVAIGNPFGYDRTLTSGIVSATGREISSPNSSPIENAIQTDAAINHGNSGGPLIDRTGAVIGVTSQISTGNTGGQGNIGIGFAIPVDLVRSVAAQLIKTGFVQHPYLGVVVAPVNAQLAKLFGLPTKRGLLVTVVEKSSAASKAGLKAGTTSVIVQGTSYRLGGDIIVSADGQALDTFQQLRAAINAHKPGDKLHFQVYRSGKERTVTVTLGSK